MLSPAIHAAIHAVYGAALDPASWPLALDRMAEAIDCEAALILFSRDDGRTGTIVSPGLVEASKAYQEIWWQHDLRFQRGMEEGFLLRDVYVDRHLMSPEERVDLPFYRDFLIPRGLGQIACTAVAPDARTTVILSFHRSHAKPPFDEATEMQQVFAFGRHAELALGLSMRLMESEFIGQSLAQALGKVGTAVFFLDSGRRVTFSNEAADLLVGHGLAIRQGKLTAESIADRAALDQAIAEAAEGGLDRAPAVLHPQNGPPLAVFAMPVIRRVAILGGLFASSELMVLVQGGQPPTTPVDTGLVKAMFGLTTGEARLAVLIAAGRTLRAAAGTLGIAEGTARVVLKRVFDKVGVNRQSELVARFAQLSMGAG